MAGSDSKFMRMALRLAEKAWGMTSPNPMVGTVLVRNGVVVGRGFHERAGLPHAEVNAIADAGKKARGSDLYVTLEPCSTHGRTPPCVDAILGAGVRRVFVGVEDPNPRHSGAGVAILRKAGVEVECGVEEEKCRELNEAFFKWVAKGTPFVLLKMAMTLDGKIATASGESKWITGPAARRRVHKLRQWADAILIGGGTARTDRPSLSVRDLKGPVRQPRRIVVSGSLTKKDLEDIMGGDGLPKPDLFSLSTSDDWTECMRNLAAENVLSVLIEGGGELASSALRAGVVDKVEFHVAPKILCGSRGRPVVGGADPASLAEALSLKNVRVRMLGGDISISGYL